MTLIEHLRHDFGLEIPLSDEALPQDGSGIDVPLVLHTFRQAVRDIDRWDVLEAAQIGFFSFTKFLMWRDLNQRLGDLLRSPVVAHLVNQPDLPFGPDSNFPRSEQLDDGYPPQRSFCPLPADASQLAAVFAAAEGRSFVLEGPPGTGKSQTITNLIAHCLAEGKTVLFVSEKMAALSVVFERLQKVGLGRFCLELHSAKSQKAEVLAQIKQALSPVAAHTPQEWEREAERLAGLRNELNAYVRALHRERSTGETVFLGLSRLSALRDKPVVRLSWSSADDITREALRPMRDIVAELETVAQNVGNHAENAWRAVRKPAWTPGLESQVKDRLAALAASTEELAAAAAALSSRLGLSVDGASIALLDAVSDLAALLLEAPAPTHALLTISDWPGTRARLADWTDQGRQRDELRGELYTRFEKKILRLDLDALTAQLERADGSWWPASWFRRRPVVKALRSVLKTGQKIGRADLAPALEAAVDLRDREQSLKGMASEARELLGRHWKGGEAGWDDIDKLCVWVERFRSAVARASLGSADRLVAIRDAAARLAVDASDLVTQGGEFAPSVTRFQAALGLFRQSRTALEADLDLDVGLAWGDDARLDALETTRVVVARWAASVSQLRTWCAWRRVRDEAVRRNLLRLVEGIESGAVPSGEVRGVFERSFYEWWVGAVLDTEPVLSGFFSPTHQAKIQTFREADERVLALTRGIVAARLAAGLPSDSVAEMKNSELGFLQRELGKKRRHTAVRKLLQTIPTLLPRLKPCLLMSPMSVAQYLDSALAPFDMVVFDEASQIPVWDAIGALARGKQAIVVGDPKQLPPTTFFERAAEDDEAEDAEVVEDLESILDECLGARLPWLPLDWHYRSRHESLIAFSNHHYYQNRLLTFPSPDREGIGVSWRHVPAGVYDKGKSRTNRAEAEAVVGEVLRRLRSQELREHSIGVVTFSQAQQTLIEDLLDEARREHADVDAFFTENGQESVFVKNLENVQGDERDVILFSIGYGPDAQGRVSMNFGPMNREGGERRLNVAITRARREVIVFSTLRAEQIDLARTRARGVRDLKYFLEYAERGVAALAQATAYDADAEVESPFEGQVRDALTSRGWLVHPQVGCSSYRIDLAVVDPAAPGRYLLGIECDGANYHRAKTARDRDKLREAVLRDLGWDLHRVWSTDWWTDPKGEIEKIERALEGCRARIREPVRIHPEPIEPQRQLFARAPSPAPVAASTVEPPMQPVVPRVAPTSVVAPPSPASAAPRTYQPFPIGRLRGGQLDYYEPVSAAAIRSLIEEVVAFEGPVSLALTARRVAAHWDFARVKEKALRRVRSLIPEDRIAVKQEGELVFLWSSVDSIAEFRDFRVPGDDPATHRDPEDLPLEEIANAALHLLRTYGSAPRADLIRETSRLFGFLRTGRLIEDRIARALATLPDCAAVAIAGERVSLTRG